MAEGIKFKFTDYHDSEGIKVKHKDGQEIVLNQGEGVKPAPVQVENGFIQGQTLEEIFKVASKLEPRKIEKGDVVIEKKLEVKNEDEVESESVEAAKIAENVVEKSENTQENQEKIRKYQDAVLRVTNAVKRELEKRAKTPGLLAIFHTEVHELWRRKETELLELEGQDLEDRIKVEMLEAVASHHHDKSQKELLEICRQVFGVFAGGSREHDAKVVEEKETEKTTESQEQKECRETAEKIFSEIFDPTKAEYKEIKFKTVKGGNANVATSLRNAWFKSGTGLMGALVEKFLQENIEANEENFKAYCLKNIDTIEVFDKKGAAMQPSENVKTAMKLACGFRESEKQEDDVEKEKLKKEIEDISDECVDLLAEIKKRNDTNRDSGFYGEGAEDFFNEQAGYANEIDKALYKDNKLLDNGKADEELLKLFKLNRDELQRISGEFDKWTEKYKKETKETLKNEFASIYGKVKQIINGFDTKYKSEYADVDEAKDKLAEFNLVANEVKPFHDLFVKRSEIRQEDVDAFNQTHEKLEKITKELGLLLKKQGTEKSKNLENKPASFEEYKERITHGKEWRMKDVNAGKKNVPPFEFENFKVIGLSSTEIGKLKEYFFEAQEELRTLLDEKSGLAQDVNIQKNRQEEYFEHRLKYVHNAIGVWKDRLANMQPEKDKLEAFGYYERGFKDIKRDGFKGEYLKKLDAEIELGKKELKAIWAEKKKEFATFEKNKALIQKQEKEAIEKLEQEIETAFGNLKHELEEFASEIKKSIADDSYGDGSSGFFKKQMDLGEKMWQESQDVFGEFEKSGASKELYEKIDKQAHKVLDAHESFRRAKETYKRGLEQDFSGIPNVGFGGEEKEVIVNVEKEPDFANISNGGFLMGQRDEQEFADIPEGGFEKTEDHGDAPDKEPDFANIPEGGYEGNAPHPMEEPVDNHAPFEGEKNERTEEEKEILEMYVENAASVGHYLMEEFENDGTFVKNGDDSLEKKIARVREEVAQIATGMLERDQSFTSEKAQEFGKEISQRFKL